MSREAMQMALDAFDYFFPTEDGQLWHTANDVKKIDDARQALIDALADDGGYADDTSLDHVDETVKQEHEEKNT